VATGCVPSKPGVSWHPCHALHRIEHKHDGEAVSLRLDSALEYTRKTPETLYPPTPNYVRSRLKSRSSSVESVDSLSSGRDHNYVDLTYYTDAARRDVGERSGENSGRPSFNHSKDVSGEHLHPGMLGDCPSSSSPTLAHADSPGSRPSSRPASRAVSLEGHRRPLSEHLDMDDMKRAPSPFAKEFGVSNDQASIRELMIDTEDMI
jgi:hypothetical protein